jgi:hypothetical protein
MIGGTLPDLARRIEPQIHAIFAAESRQIGGFARLRRPVFSLAAN